MSVDDFGYYNLMLAIVDRAREDFIDGYKYLMNTMGRIPNEVEFKQWVKKYEKSSNKNERAQFYAKAKKGNHFYSAVGFVVKDPFNLFDDRATVILKAWKKCAMKGDKNG